MRVPRRRTLFLKFLLIIPTLWLCALFYFSITGNDNKVTLKTVSLIFLTVCIQVYLFILIKNIYTMYMYRRVFSVYIILCYRLYIQVSVGNERQLNPKHILPVENKVIEGFGPPMKMDIDAPVDESINRQKNVQFWISFWVVVLVNDLVYLILLCTFSF